MNKDKIMIGVWSGVPFLIKVAGLDKQKRIRAYILKRLDGITEVEGWFNETIHHLSRGHRIEELYILNLKQKNRHLKEPNKKLLAKGKRLWKKAEQLVVEDNI